MKKTLAIIALILFAATAAAQEAKVRWSFDALADGRTRESVSGKMDALEGYAERGPGVLGDGLRLDGFTACLRAAGPDRVVTGDEISVEAWIALGESPWNWCPVLTSENDEVKGYRLMVGPLGQAAIEGGDRVLGAERGATTMRAGSMACRTRLPGWTRSCIRPTCVMRRPCNRRPKRS